MIFKNKIKISVRVLTSQKMARSYTMSKTLESVSSLHPALFLSQSPSSPSGTDSPFLHLVTAELSGQTDFTPQKGRILSLQDGVCLSKLDLVARAGQGTEQCPRVRRINKCLPLPLPGEGDFQEVPCGCAYLRAQQERSAQLRPAVIQPCSQSSIPDSYHDNCLKTRKV